MFNMAYICPSLPCDIFKEEVPFCGVLGKYAHVLLGHAAIRVPVTKIENQITKNRKFFFAFNQESFLKNPVQLNFLITK